MADIKNSTEPTQTPKATQVETPEQQDNLLQAMQVGEMRMERNYRMELHLGTRMLLRFGWAKEKSSLDVPAELIGYIHYECILVRVQPTPGLLPRINQGSSVSVRFLNDGVANIFQTELISHLTRPALILALAYPSTMNSIQVRKHKRLSSALPVLINKDGQEISGIINDISRGGCRLIMDVRGQSGARNIVVGDKLNLLVPLDLKKGLDNLYTTVKNVETEQYRVVIGLSFEALPPNVSHQLDNFLSCTETLLS